MRKNAVVVATYFKTSQHVLGVGEGEKNYLVIIICVLAANQSQELDNTKQES
jgi:hypothetical protein